MSDIASFLSKSLVENNYSFDASTQQTFLQYLHLLHHWNKTINLTAIRDPHESVLHHIIDSLSISPYLKGKRFIDVGSGAGLPGIPLAITQPDKEIILLDSNGKKTRFLTQVAIELGLKNVEVIQARVESYNPDKGFDGIITRAFASLSDMVIQTKHLLNPNGEWLAMKGVYPEEELNQLPAEVKIIEVIPLKIKGLNKERCLVKLKNEQLQLH